MFIYGKMAADAIAVASYLAEHPDRLCGSSEISGARNISRALTAKLLTRLATAGITEGRPGPGGGYRLARDAKDVSLRQIVELFEQTGTVSLCPFGHGWCGTGEECPLHHTLVGMVEDNAKFLETTTLSVFEPSGSTSRRRRAASRKGR